jgi:GTP-binding protein
MSEPVVAIVGRPNVGKSTLFNRIIGRREAIVDDAPGITRDRKSADAEWAGVRFTLVDTGGFIPKSKDVIEIGVTQQVRFAIEESDFILFLVDCTTGITDVDGEAAKILKKSKKAWVLAVNKVDSEKRESDAAEFIRLGLGEPVTISALGGRGIGDLLSRIVSELNSTDEPNSATDEKAVKLAVVGKPNVGKSTFINTIVGEDRLLVTEVPGTTRDAVDVCFRAGDREFVLIDTAGMRRRSRVKENVEYYSALRAHRVVERCDVACVFTDAGEGLTQQDLHVVNEVLEAKKGIVLVVNKWDLVKDDPEKVSEWEEGLRRKLHGTAYIPVVFVSCKTNLRVKKVLDLARQTMEERGKRISSPDLNRFIEDLNRRIQPPAIQGKRVRILYGTQVGVNPPKFVFFSNFPHLITENYGKFLENQIRERFGFTGVPLSLVFKRK